MWDPKLYCCCWEDERPAVRLWRASLYRYLRLARLVVKEEDKER
jgi:hypothetical protein